MNRLSALFSVTIIIAAASLITLPFEVLATNCNESAWNRALEHQHQLEKQYNHHARRFNQLVGLFNTQPFLHQEFEFAQIVNFWQKEKRDLHNMMSSQITAAYETTHKIELETAQVVSLLAPVTEQTQQWEIIHRDCVQQQDEENSVASRQYIANSQQLHSELNQLIGQLGNALTSYQYEIKVLERAREAQKVAMENPSPQVNN